MLCLRLCCDSFNSRRSDFGPENDQSALDRYNEYLEKAEDFVYELTMGDAAEVQRATNQLDLYEQTHRAEIERNYARAAEEQRKANAKLFAARNAASGAAAPNPNPNDLAAAGTAMGMGGPALAPAKPAPFVGPQPKIKQPSKSASMEIDSKTAGSGSGSGSGGAALSGEERLKALFAQKLKKEKQKIAGGWLPAYDLERCRSEAIASLMLELNR